CTRWLVVTGAFRSAPSRECRTGTLSGRSNVWDRDKSFTGALPSAGLTCISLSLIKPSCVVRISIRVAGAADASIRVRVPIIVPKRGRGPSDSCFGAPHTQRSAGEFPPVGRTEVMTMMRAVLAVLFACCVLPSPLFAAQNAGQAVSAAERMQQAGPQELGLRSRTGTWEVVTTMWPKPGAAPVVTRGLVAERAMVGPILQEIMRPGPG